jgi:hypothetical protein
MTIEPGDHLDTLSIDVEDFISEIDFREDCSIPPEWTSPLTCQWFGGISKNYIETQMLLLVGLTHNWLATFLNGENHRVVPNQELLRKRAGLRQSIESFAPMGSALNIEAESRYESCRWASLILLAVEKMSVPIRVAAKFVRIQPRLVRRLRMTSLSSLWGTHKGLLLWVTVMCHFATAGQCFPILCTTLLARFSQEMAMSEFCFEIAIKPLKRLKQFESVCCSPVSTDVTATLAESVVGTSDGSFNQT